jgi:hypothetical protein
MRNFIRDNATAYSWHALAEILRDMATSDDFNKDFKEFLASIADAIDKGRLEIHN